MGKLKQLWPENYSYKPAYCKQNHNNLQWFPEVLVHARQHMKSEKCDVGANMLLQIQVSSDNYTV